MALDLLGLVRGLVGEVGRLLSDQAQLGQGDFANASTAAWGRIMGGIMAMGPSPLLQGTSSTLA